MAGAPARGWTGVERGLTGVERRVHNGVPRAVKPQADAAPPACLLAWQTAEEVTVMIVIIAAIEAWVRRRRAKKFATASWHTDA
jgi:hypothetical protein